MREHMGLFRGKRLDNSEWIEGYYIAHLHAAHYIIPFRTGGYAAMDNSFYVHKWFEVDPDTVGECTGLTDKNGKLVFEGDICKIRNLTYMVEFKYSAWQFTILSDKVYCYPAFNSHCGEYCEIIGNIHDNPELLEGEEPADD